MNRRKALKQLGILGGALPIIACSKDNTNNTTGGIGRAMEMNNQSTNTNLLLSSNGFGNDFHIPPIAKYETKNNVKHFNLIMQEGVKNFVGKDVPTYGINGDYLAPSIKVRTSDMVSMSVTNNLPETTTLHWHGMHIEGDKDGTPHQIIDLKKTWNPEFQIQNIASTLWYHPHPDGRTAPQVYKGLAGLIIIEDENSDSLDIPKQYGIDDIPLILQDRYFDDDGDMIYFDDFRSKMMGFRGNTFLVNGVHQPTLKAEKTLLRFRILNGSNSTNWSINFSDNREFYQIATDGGLLETPVKMTNIYIAPAERVEIVVDISDKKDDLYLQNKDFTQTTNVFKIDTKNAKQSPHKKLTSNYKLATIQKIDEKMASVQRNMDMRMLRGRVSINNKTMDMHRIDEKVKLGATEIWTITNNKEMRGMGMQHPFHLHGTSFLILSRNGIAPPKHEQGWKDVVLVSPQETVKIIATFKHKADALTPYMYHCHILEHEDLGMMGQFSVE